MDELAADRREGIWHLASQVQGIDFSLCLHTSHDTHYTPHMTRDTRHTTFIVTLYQLSLGIFTQCRHPCAGYIHRQHAIICHVYELIIIRTIKCNYMLG